MKIYNNLIIYFIMIDEARKRTMRKMNPAKFRKLMMAIDNDFDSDDDSLIDEV